MAGSSCRHEWKIINLRNGYLVTEGCTICGGRASFFAMEDHHHLDTYVDGKHKWRFFGSSQATRFDLQCTQCEKIIELKNVISLMFCTECRDDCDVLDKKKNEKGENTWIYVALCPDCMHESGTCVSDEEIQALDEYFNGNIKMPGKRVCFVPCSKRISVDLCQGDIIADVGMKEIY